MTTKLKLSEAIRLGSMMTTQGFGYRSMNNATSPCALGAARLAAGVHIFAFSKPEMLSDTFPILLAEVNIHDLPPLYNLPFNQREKVKIPHPLFDVIWRLNDVVRWSREQIADYVASIESELDRTLIESNAEVEEVKEVAHV